ncbi:MAG: DUF6644 family protein [Acidobacteriota bacterium]
MIEFLRYIENLSFSTWVREGGALYGYPLILFTHTLCLAAVVGGNLLIDLRLLGFANQMPIKPLEKLYPVMWIGFGINAVTGTILLMADATTKARNPTFWVKLTLIFIGVGVLKVMRKQVFGDPNVDQHPVTSQAKRLAVASLICWLGALTAGRLLAYLGPVAGLASL